MQDPVYQCRICRNEYGNRLFRAREMMFGMDEEFEYIECGRCGCLQILRTPENTETYYPPSYYSLIEPKKDWLLKRWLKRERAIHDLGGESWIGEMCSNMFGRTPWAQWVRHAKINYESLILDIGCGSGELLHQMHQAGFRHLTGIDPYLKEDLNKEKGFRILKRDLNQVRGRFDCIMLHHVLEHLPDTWEAMKRVSQHLRPGGAVIVRIPVADSWAWRHYGIHWSGLDAPRHLTVHTRGSFALVAEKTGFYVETVIDDSSPFQFWVSELYQRGIPLIRKNARDHHKPPQLFSRKQLKEFTERARELNQSNQGDNVCFYLRKVRE